MTAFGYEVWVSGTLPPEVVDELGDVQVQTVPPSTVVSGVVPDQAALLGMLARLRAMGLEVTELRRVGEEPEAGPADATQGDVPA